MLLYALGDFRSARGSSTAESITAGQDIATYAANTTNAANIIPTATAAAKNNTTNSELLN